MAYLTPKHHQNEGATALQRELGYVYSVHGHSTGLQHLNRTKLQYCAELSIQMNRCSSVN